MSDIGLKYYNYGWVCPKCEKSLAPTQTFCIFCASIQGKADSKTTTSEDKKMPPNWPEIHYREALDNTVTCKTRPLNETYHWPSGMISGGIANAKSDNIK